MPQGGIVGSYGGGDAMQTAIQLLMLPIALHNLPGESDVPWKLSDVPWKHMQAHHDARVGVQMSKTMSTQLSKPPLSNRTQYHQLSALPTYLSPSQMSN